MAKPSRPHNLSKKFLMGVALSVVPLAGCVELGNENGLNDVAPIETSDAVTAKEVALFERAKSLRTVAAAEQFLRTYPDSELVRSLLTRLPESTLRGVGDDLVKRIPQSVINSLPFSVQQALGITASAKKSQNSGAADGYGG
jgi:hypothetical protein